ncbi:hypothetical protein niasHT_003332 [Heterodera trifolii]|uniref:HAT C-terminal dimerisation domain-containing protein n=1 Tax=Heterodera trifolii TaxID=157864 RepID=A0ABD2LXS9_9BILA
MDPSKGLYNKDEDKITLAIDFTSDKYNITGLVKECANFPIEKLPNVFVAFEQALLLNMEAYHLCRHAQSFESSDCVSSDGLFKTMFSDSAVAKKFGCARNKASKIITGVLAPYSVQIMLSELGNHYFSIALDSFNHKTTKLFPIVIRYFVAENGIQVRLLDLQALPGETAEEVYQWILKMLQKHGLKFERIVAFCADNTAANFGSAEHRGENNVFYKLRAHKNNLIPVGCPAHVLHNAAKRGADNLSIDIESIVFKLTSHFKNSTKRTTLDYIDKWFRLERFPKSISWVGLDENEAQLPNLYMLISKVFAIPVSNAFVERVFSLCGAQWTDTRNSLEVETVKNLVQERKAERTAAAVEEETIAAGGEAGGVEAATVTIGMCLLIR